MSDKSLHPWKILLASEDRGLLRALSRFLRVFGCEVDEAADAQQALAAWEAKRPDFLIIDGDQAFQRSLQRCMSTCVMGETAKVYTFLLVEQGKCDAAAALAAGVDDFLRKPFDYGELLARLQTGARSLEFERRLRRQAGAHPLTGCLTRSALLRRMRVELAQAASADRSYACVMLDLDFFCRVKHLYGFGAGDTLLRVVGETIRRRCTEGETLACFGADRFGVFLHDFSESDAADWAEQIRAELAEAEFAWESAVVRVTASFGVAAARGKSIRAEDFIEMASEALRYAKSSGRNCVARYREFDDESRAWTDLAAPGRLFERTLARDVMLPCAVVLSPKDPLSAAERAFGRTRLGALPVVDASGKVKGLLLEETVFDELSDSRRRTATVGEVMLADPPQFPEQEKFASLLDFFTRQSHAAAIITDNGRPTGIIMPQNLATLTTPLHSASFAPDDPDLTGSELLVVPELCPAGDSALE
ncbi:MAG: diguanylate cyclase [Planctomycetes bacterium]|nr:diguanylate cyclase [Planctomycetota bacterium]